MKLLAQQHCFGGKQQRYEHISTSLNCTMVFSVYLPPQADKGKVPVLYWLSGLTCTDENFTHKAGAQRYAAEQGIALVMPDTSPRGEGVPDDPDGSWDFGLGAGFYVNATEQPWAEHYRMYDYVVKELPALVESELPLDGERRSISGHSMGGHGAITIALRHPDRYRSVSAFAPIAAPSECPWGHKALGYYLGEDPQKWLQHDSSALIRNANQHLPLLVDQGDADDFLPSQLKTEQLVSACQDNRYPATIRYQAGYDHSYYFIASFIGEHIAFHAKAMN